MSDDIVTRLRMSADLIDGFPKARAKNLFPTSWLPEAADEIEGLQAQLNAMTEMRDKWRTIAKNLGAEDFSYVEPE